LKRKQVPIDTKQTDQTPQLEFGTNCLNVQVIFRAENRECRSKGQAELISADILEGV
jgi:hypothetical protein